MRNLYLLTNTLQKGGAEKQVIQIAKNLQNNFNVNIIVYWGGQVDNEYLLEIRNTNCKLICLQGNIVSKIWRILSMRFIDGDVVYSFLLLTNLINGFLKILKPKILCIGSIRSSYLKYWKRSINKFLHNYVFNYTIINNQLGIQTFSSFGFNKDKFFYIPNFISLDVQSLLEKPTHTKLKILSVGRFDISKDYKTAILAINEIVKNKEHHNIEYTIVGYGNLKTQIVQLIKSLNLHEYVKIVIRPSNVEYYYSISDIYLSSSIFEGLSNSILEAMSYSLPIIATDVGDNKILVSNNTNGFLVKKGGVQSIVNNIIYLSNNRPKIIEYGLNSSYKLKNNFSTEKIKQKYLQVFEQNETL